MAEFKQKVLVTSSIDKELDYIWAYLIKNGLKIARFTRKIDKVSQQVKKYAFTKFSLTEKSEIDNLVDNHSVFWSTISDWTNNIYKLIRPFEILIIDQCRSDVIPKALGKIRIAKQFIIFIQDDTESSSTSSKI